MRRFSVEARVVALLAHEARECGIPDEDLVAHVNAMRKTTYAAGLRLRFALLDFKTAALSAMGRK